MNTSDLLQELGQKLGLGPLALDDSGNCQLVFDGDLVVELQAPGDGFISLVATVCPVPADGREALFTDLLEANLLGQGTGGATLALDTALDEVVLCQRLETAQLDNEGFEGALETFINHLEFWKGRTSSSAGGTGSANENEKVPFIKA
jgi:Tir chaperone protein (CesT).